MLVVVTTVLTTLSSAVPVGRVTSGEWSWLTVAVGSAAGASGAMTTTGAWSLYGTNSSGSGTRSVVAAVSIAVISVAWMVGGGLNASTTAGS